MPITSVSVFMVYMHVSNTGGGNGGGNQKEEVLSMPREMTRPAGFGLMTGRSAGFVLGTVLDMLTLGLRAGARGSVFTGRRIGRGYRRMYYATGQPGCVRFEGRWGPAAGGIWARLSPIRGAYACRCHEAIQRRGDGVPEREAGLLREELDTGPGSPKRSSGSGEGAEE